MHRRRFLELATLGSAFVAGCTADESPSTASPTSAAASSGPTATAPPSTAGDGPAEPYSRAFEPLDAGELNVGAYYAFIAAERWDCLDGSPAVGPYDSTAEPAVVNHQIDLMQGFGVGRVVFRYADAAHQAAIDQFTDASLADEIDVELAYDLPSALTSNRDLDAELTGFAELFDRSNYGTHDGRPVVTLGAVDALLADGERGRTIRSALPAEAPEADIFLSALRSTLSGAGAEPYLVADLGPVDADDLARMFDRNGEVFKHVDAVTNRRVLPTSDGTLPWSDAFEATRRSFRALSAFGTDRDLDVIPTVYPGIDRSMDECGDDRARIPRSPDQLGSMLKTAMGSATTPQVRIDSFNDWPRGTQIEPGSAHGRAYDRAYLKAVEGFVTALSGEGGGDRRVHYVSPDGSDGYVGSRTSPLRTIQAGVDRAQPGDTVHVLPGRYFESVRTRRSGTASAPITITGPPEAVLAGERRDGFSAGVFVSHSHVHLRGLTIDGLQDPDAPDDVASYMHIGIHTNPNLERKLAGLVYKPHAIGNLREAMVTVSPAEHVEVGEFRVIGPCGLDFLLGDRIGHFGEIVYVGTGGIPTDVNDVHIHHIDNSAGHPHIELVDVKGGSRDVLVEYCTSVGARLPSDNDNSTAVHIGGTDVTFRWNRVESAAFNAIDVGNYVPYSSYFPDPDEPMAGKGNEIYGNVLVDAGASAINYTSETSEADQRVVCGNVVDTETDGDPSRPCSAAVPAGDGVGHLGGDSPWT